MSYLVLHVRPYDFEADDGRRVSGVSVTYLDLDSGAAGPATAPVGGELGYAPLTIPAPERVARDFQQVPGLYELHFHHRRGKGGRPVLALGAATFDRPANLEAL